MPTQRFVKVNYPAVMDAFPVPDGVIDQQVLLPSTARPQCDGGELGQRFCQLFSLQIEDASSYGGLCVVGVYTLT